MFARNGRTARVENEFFKCWYYDPSFVINNLKKEFDVLSLEGLYTLVPPSYMEGFAEKHPTLYSKLVSMESKWNTRWPWKNVGDYYIITLRKK